MPVGAGPALNLLADVIEGGLSPENRSRLTVAGVEVAGDGLDRAEALARHQHVFGFAIPPYAGVFLDPRGLTGGSTEAAAVRALSAVGIPPEMAGSSPDHVSGLARTVGLLLEASGPELAGHFASAHCLSWMPSLALAVRREGASEYADLIDVLVEILLQVAIAGSGEGGRPSLPDEEPPLDRQQSGVRELSRYLTTHLYTGAYLGRNTLRRIAGRTESPSGFGGRALMLTNLLNSAASFDQLDPVTDLIGEEVGASIEMWVARSDSGPLGVWAEVWIPRLERTKAVLRRVRESVREEAGKE